jgi:hypothetical protein
MENRSSVESLFDSVKTYLETRLNLIKLKAIDKSSGIISLVISFVTLGIISLFVFIFLNIGLALLIGEWLGRASYGFFILTAVYVIIGVVIFKNRNKGIKKPILNTLIKTLLD